MRSSAFNCEAQKGPHYPWALAFSWWYPTTPQCTVAGQSSSSSLYILSRWWMCIWRAASQHGYNLSTNVDDADAPCIPICPFCMKHHSHTEAGACPFISWLSLTTLTARMDFLSQQETSVWTNDKVWSKIFFCAPFIQCLLPRKVRSLVHVFQITTAFLQRANRRFFSMGQPSLQNNLWCEDNEMGYCGIEWWDRRRRLDMKIGGELKWDRRGAVGKGFLDLSAGSWSPPPSSGPCCAPPVSSWHQELRMCAQRPTLLLMPQVGLQLRNPVLFHLPKGLSNIWG